MSVLRSHTDKIRDREETAGQGGGGVAWRSQGPGFRGGDLVRGAWETAVLHLLHVLRWFLSVSDLKPNTSF